MMEGNKNSEAWEKDTESSTDPECVSESLTETTKKLTLDDELSPVAVTDNGLLEIHDPVMFTEGSTCQEGRCVNFQSSRTRMAIYERLSQMPGLQWSMCLCSSDTVEVVLAHDSTHQPSAETLAADLQIPSQCLKVSKLSSECPVEMTAWGDDIIPGCLIVTSHARKVSTFAAFFTTGGQLYALMPGHAAVFGETVYGCRNDDRAGILGRVILNLQEGSRTSKPGGGSMLTETCDVAVVAIDEAGVHVENSVTDFEGRQLSIATQPAEVICDQPVQTFCSGAGQIRGSVKLVGFTSRQCPHICDCIGLLQNNGEPLHGPSQSGLLVTDVPTESSINDASVNCLAMLIAVQEVAVQGEPLRKYSLAVPMSRVFQRLRDQQTFRNSGPLSFVSPSPKPRRTSSTVSALDLREEEPVGEVGVGDLSTVATASHI